MLCRAIGLLSTLSLYGSRKQMRTQTNANSNRPFFFSAEKDKGKGTATPPLNCNINPVVGEINPLRPRVEDYGTSIKLGGNADVRALYLSL